MAEHFLKQTVEPVIKPLLQHLVVDRPENVCDWIVTYLTKKQANKIDTRCLWNTFTGDEMVDGFTLAMTSADITAEWLGRAINQDVVSLNTQVCGGGAIGVAVLLTDIVYANADEADNLPKSFALKMHGMVEQQRENCGNNGLYFKEIHVFDKYGRGKDKFSIPMPQIYAIWVDDRQPLEKVHIFNILMPNLNEDWLAWDQMTPAPPYNIPSMEEWKHVFTTFATHHVEYWNHSLTRDKVFCPSSDGKFSLGEQNEAFALQWGERYHEIRSFFADYSVDTVKHLDSFVSDVVAGDGGRDGKRIFHAAMKRLREAPMTIVHGDLNSGNIWHSKTGGNELLFADWQICMAAPVAFDFITPFMGFEPEKPFNTDCAKLLKHFHQVLCKLKPSIAEELSYEQLEEQVKCIFCSYGHLLMNLGLGMMVDAAKTGQMEKEKMDFMLSGVGNCLRRMACANEAWDINAFEKKLLLQAKEENLGI